MFPAAIFCLRKFNWGPSIKDVRTKSRKIDPTCPQNARTGPNPLPPCLCGHTINFEKSEVFCSSNCGGLYRKKLFCLQNVRIGLTSLRSDCGRLLWTAPYCNYKYGFSISAPYLQTVQYCLLEG